MIYGLFCEILLMGYSGTEALKLSDYIRKLNRPDLSYHILQAIGCKTDSIKNLKQLENINKE